MSSPHLYIWMCRDLPYGPWHPRTPSRVCTDTPDSYDTVGYIRRCVAMRNRHSAKVEHAVFRVAVADLERVPDMKTKEKK